ncbi:hypothetical protein PHMEG_00037626, partial [Phytophthora megakarya]
MNFMVPAGVRIVRIDTADGTACLPDEVRIQMIGRRPLYGSKMRSVTVPSLIVAAGQTFDVSLRPEKNAPRLWVTRGTAWVTSVIRAPVGRRMCLRVTNITEKSVVLDAHTTVGRWTPVDSIPRAFGFVRPGSRKYDEWQNLAYETTSDVSDKEIFQESREPMTERRVYARPQMVMHRPEETQNMRVERRQEQVAVVAAISRRVAADIPPTRDARSPGLGDELHSEREQGDGPRPRTGSTDGPNQFGVDFENIPEYEHADEEVIFHEGSDLFAEDVEAEMAVLPEVPLTAEVKIGDLKIGRPEGVDPKEAEEMEERLRQIVWKKRKWLIGKGNALPPAAKGVICDIDVGNARLVAQRVRKISPQFREKLADLIRGLLSERMIRASKSPLINGLTQLMVYPMPLVTDLLEDLDKYRWYCSLDMASGFWVVPMTDRARLISAFVPPFV